MYFPKNHFLENLIDQKVNILKSAGLIDYLIEKYVPKQVKVETFLGPKKLTVDQLAGGIFVFLMGCFISLISFVVEIVIKKRT